jgi:hypothetical protein
MSTKLTAASGNPVEPEMNPAEEVPPPIPGEEHICTVCGGGGVLDDGTRCEHCGGTGKVSPTGV